MIIILMGESCAGKTACERKLPFKRLISHTTRPRRNNEPNDYYFVDNETFNKTEMVESVSYNVNGEKWRYGLSVDELKKALNEDCVVTLNPLGVEQVISKCDKLGIEHKVFYLKATLKTRLKRAIKREQVTEQFKIKMFDRIFQDLEDFEIIDDLIDVVIDTNVLDINGVCELILESLNINEEKKENIELWKSL